MPRKSARDLWKARLAGKLPPPEFGDTPYSVGRRQFQGIVLGIDPSLRGTGLTLLKFGSGGRVRLLLSRTVKLKPSLPMANCLGEISRTVRQILVEFHVDHVALEQSIYVQNTQTALILGAARGAAIAAADCSGLPVFEYAPLRIKQAVVGFGRASKHQMARTVKSLLGHTDIMKPDEADAAGVALCHAFTYKE